MIVVRFAASVSMIIIMVVCLIYSAGALAMGIMWIGELKTAPILAGLIALVVLVIGMYGFAFGWKSVFETVTPVAERVSPEFARVDGWRRAALNVSFVALFFLVLAITASFLSGPVPTPVSIVITVASFISGVLHLSRKLHRRGAAV